MDPELALEAAAEHLGVAMVFAGRCPGGEVGAYYATAEDGQSLVFKTLAGLTADDWRWGVAGCVTRLRAKGYPAPAYLPLVPVPGGGVQFQERVEETWTDEVTFPVIERLVALNALQAGEGEGERDWTGYIRWTLVEGADWYCVHEPMRLYSPTTRRMLDQIEATGRALGPLPCGDLTHFDFNHRNLLYGSGDELWVVDCDAFDDGDRRYDLVTLVLGLRMAGVDPGVDVGASPGVEAELWRIIERDVGPDARAAYVAHNVLRRVEWRIRKGTPAEVEALLPRMAALLAKYC